VRFEWEDEPQPRAVRLVRDLARDPVRVTVAGGEGRSLHRGCRVLDLTRAREMTAVLAVKSTEPSTRSILAAHPMPFGILGRMESIR
jgi:hypothetical protein